MAFEEDFLLRQIRGMSQFVAKLLQFKSEPLDIEFVQDEDGQLKPAREYLAQLVELEKFDLACQYIASFEGKMSNEEYQGLTDIFLDGMSGQPEADVAAYRAKLKGNPFTS